MREKKSEEQLTKDLEILLRKLYNRMEGTDEEKRKAIDEKVKTGIQNIAKGAKRKRKSRIDDEEFIKAAMENPDAEELAKRFGYNRATAFKKMNELGIYGRRKIVGIIKQQEEKGDEEIAQEAHVNIDVVTAIRRKIQETEKKNEKGKREKRKRKSRIDDEEFIKAAMENPNAEELAKRFGYNRATSFRKMNELGICSRRKIAMIIKQQGEEKSDEEIAQEAHVSIEVVKEVREKVLGGHATVKKSSKGKQVGQVEQGKQEQQGKQVEQARQERQARAKEREDARKEFIYEATKNSDLNQLANKYRVSKGAISSRMRNLGISPKNDDASLNRSIEIAEVKAEVQQGKEKEKEEKFVKMATELATTSEIQNRLLLNEYDVILLLRKYGILSREDVERLIESTKMTDQEISLKANCDVKAVANVRKVVKAREKLISEIPEEKIPVITRMIKSQDATTYIKSQTRVSFERIEALKAKVLRDAKQNIPEKSQIVDFKNTIMSIKYGTQANSDKGVLKLKVSKVLALYEQFLTAKDEALIAYAYLQSGCYLEAIEFCEKYLGLTTPTTEAAVQLIRKITDEEVKKDMANPKKSSPTDVGGGHDNR